jgi:hypothetical protein
MRVKILLVVVLCVFPLIALADSITQLTPTSFNLNDSEVTITVDGTGLTGTQSTKIQFDGPSGTVVVDVGGGSPTELITTVPPQVLGTAGTYSLTVLATDQGQPTRVIGPANFTVVAPPQQPPLLFTPETVNAEATSPSGAVVTFTVSGFSFVDPSPTVNCDHASGAQYPLGSTIVNCSAMDSFATTFGSFEIIVADTTPPVLTLPADILSSSPVVNFTVTATDNIDGPVNAICSPASGSTFPLGTTTVRCSAADTHANVTVGTFKVTYATGAPPSLTLPSNITAEATLPFAAIVNYSATSDPGVPVNCSPASGSRFNYGTTTVQCSATSSNGATTSGSFQVSVVDTTAPVLVLPSDITVTSNDPSGAVVTFDATSNDVNDVHDAVTCTPGSGSLFAPGTTTVNCSATDQSGNTATGSFHVTVNLPLPPPTLTLPNDFTVEATGPNGAMVTYVATANQNATVVCTPASGATFPLGVTTVQCSATNNLNEVTNGSFHVTVADTTAPTLTLPSDITVPTTTNSAVVTFTATATDIVDGTVAVTCTPASGSTFAAGTTTVVCSATDAHANTAHGSFHVTVVPPPTLTLPNDFTVEATGPSGAMVTYVATANENATVVCTPASGATFALGTTTVNCTATNSFNISTNGSFHVTVRDTTPPTLSLPADITAEATSPFGADVSYTVTAHDLVDGNVAAHCTPASGSDFPMGTTTVQCTASDSHGNTANGSFHVTVRDTTPPLVLLVAAVPDVIWPPNKRMVEVDVFVLAIDIPTFSATTSHIVSVTSNQAITSADYQITGPLTVNLRADRTNGVDRIYTINTVTVDASGNSSPGSVNVYVSHRSHPSGH